MAEDLLVLMMAMLKRKTLILLLSAIVIVVSVVICISITTAARPLGPIYQGKHLSEWLKDQQFTKRGQVVLSDASAHAVQAMGTNALSALMEMLSASDSQLKLRAVFFLDRHMHIHIPTKGERQFGAMLGIRTLGSVAKPVHGQIAKLVLGSDYNSSAINALTGADADTITSLAMGLDSPDPKVQSRAAFALGCLRQAPTISVPALTDALKDSDPEVRAGVAGSLGVYGREAQSAVPILTELSHDSNLRVSNVVAQALRSIQSTNGNRLP